MLQLRHPLHDCVVVLCLGFGVRFVAVAQPVVDFRFRLCCAGKPKLFWLILIVLITRAHRPVVLYYAAGRRRRNNRSRQRGDLLIAIWHDPVSAPGGRV